MPPPLTRDAVLDALRAVVEPDIGRDVVSLNIVRDVTIDGGRVSLTIDVPTPLFPAKEHIRERALAALRAVQGVTDADVQLASKVRSASAPEKGGPPLPGVKNVIAVGAG